MTKVFLHVGLPKCASTAVQQHFTTHCDVYARAGLLYPRTAREDVGYFSHRPLHNAPLDEIPTLVAQIAQEAAQARCHSILISSEEFTNSRWDRPEARIVIDALNKTFGDQNVTIVFLLRNHRDFVASAFAQFLHLGLFRVNDAVMFDHPPLNIAGFVDAFHHDFGFDFFDYAHFLSIFRGLAPKNPISAMSIHRQDGQMDAVEKLCRLIELPNAGPAPASNLRLSEFALFCLLHTRRFHGFRKVRSHGTFLLQGLPPHPDFRSPIFHISPALVDRIDRAAERDRRLLEPVFHGPGTQMYHAPAHPDTPPTGPVEPDDKLRRYIERIVERDDMTHALAEQIGREVFETSETRPTLTQRIKRRLQRTILTATDTRRDG